MSEGRAAAPLPAATPRPRGRRWATRSTPLQPLQPLRSLQSLHPWQVLGDELYAAAAAARQEERAYLHASALRLPGACQTHLDYSSLPFAAPLLPGASRCCNKRHSRTRPRLCLRRSRFGRHLWRRRASAGRVSAGARSRVPHRRVSRVVVRVVPAARESWCRRG